MACENHLIEMLFKEKTSKKLAYNGTRLSFQCISCQRWLDPCHNCETLFHTRVLSFDPEKTVSTLPTMKLRTCPNHRCKAGRVFLEFEINKD